MSSVSITSIRGGGAARFLAAACAVAILLAAGTRPAEAAQITIGSVNTFQTGSTPGNPAGTWTLGDKSYTYITSSGTAWTGSEVLQITTLPLLDLDTFSIGNMGTYSAQTLSLSYHIQVLNPLKYIDEVSLSVNHVANGVTVTKDVYSDAGFTNLLVSQVSVDGSSVGPASIGYNTNLWVVDTIVLAGGAVNSISNTFHQQAVPEIDIASVGGACPLLMAGLALLRRRRRPAGDAAATAAC
jgi:hypothetical protein